MHAYVNVMVTCAPTLTHTDVLYKCIIPICITTFSNFFDATYLKNDSGSATHQQSAGHCSAPLKLDHPLYLGADHFCLEITFYNTAQRGSDQTPC